MVGESYYHTTWTGGPVLGGPEAGGKSFIRSRRTTWSNEDEIYRVCYLNNQAMGERRARPLIRRWANNWTFATNRAEVAGGVWDNGGGKA